MAPTDFTETFPTRLVRRIHSCVSDQALRLRVRWSHRSLAARLAVGVDPLSEPALARCSERLVSSRHRLRLAALIDRLVRESEVTRKPSFSAALPIARAQVAAARPSLLFLAHLLRHAEPVAPRGVAIIERLLTDGHSPLYAQAGGEGLEIHVRTAIAWLVGDRRATPEAWFSVANPDSGDSLAVPEVTLRRSLLARRFRAALFFAFAFAVMADPVSSVAYAIEAALRSLNGRLDLLLPAMGLVIGIIALVTLNYWQLVGSFPEGGGSPEAAGKAFGVEWSFLPIGALIVDFALTIAISIAAAGSALIAYVPALASARIPLALGLVAVVAGLTWFGHGGRMVFAIMTTLFIAAAIAVLAAGWVSPADAHGVAPITGSASPATAAVILAFPVAMALATGTEAPATSIAQLGQLGNRGKRRFGRGTLALTIVIVGGLTMGLTALAVHLNVGIPGSDETQIANLGRAAVGSGGLFVSFQLASSMLLLAAAASSFQAGPGVLKALARTGPNGEPGLLPTRLGVTNRHHTPVDGVVLYAVISAAIILAASAREQELVLVYAVAVFVSFLAGLLAMARFSHRRGSRVLTATNLVGAGAVAFTLVVNMTRGYPLLSLGATILIAAGLYCRWVRTGRPRGIEAVERQAEAED